AVEERAELDAAVAVVVVGGLAAVAAFAAFPLAPGGFRALLGRRGALLRWGRGVRVGVRVGVGRGAALVGAAALLAPDVLAVGDLLAALAGVERVVVLRLGVDDDVVGALLAEVDARLVLAGHLGELTGGRDVVLGEDRPPLGVDLVARRRDDAEPVGVDGVPGQPVVLALRRPVQLAGGDDGVDGVAVGVLVPVHVEYVGELVEAADLLHLLEG